MASTSTVKSAPRIIVNEHEIFDKVKRIPKAPVTLVFGFSPIGRTNEMVVCNTVKEISDEFGFPTSSAEKWFVDAAMNVVRNGATALMTRLPYDNFQCHEVKYVDFTIEPSIGLKDLATGHMETKTREKDDIGVTILKEMRNLD